ncbi:protein-glutamine gamma-glutamyltransferase K-like [Lytechinus pictus]|uniref:protein-glutamine gamma-glutamyltransferase K-like n=1 Tax=Lytechinus pictus TaxID=7653 RepID=UPI0030B9D99F
MEMSEASIRLSPPPAAGRSVNVAEAERAYLGEGWDRAEAPSKPDELGVKSFDFELATNRKHHNTADYEIRNLFVRRGQPFELTVTFNKAPREELLMLQLAVVGSKVYSENRGTVIRLPFSRSESETRGDWGVYVRGVDGAKYSLLVSSPPDAIVGRYLASVIIKDKVDAEPRYFKQTDPIYVLFNAWCREDGVHMDGDTEKWEYVLNDYGFIFFGQDQPGNQFARPWVFGQFGDVTTKVVFDLLETWVREKSRNDPVIVSRMFTHFVNSSSGRDKQGLLVGNWSGDYEGGEKPTTWTGSTKIFETYAKSGKAVKYGQCWVFSGVLCTVMRCLGIPCRSVTNFSSAHDTDASMTVDTVLDAETEEEIDYLSQDSVWNFHVWNEAYFSRPDLPSMMGGWQVIDATPQETSEGLFQMGPSPKAAIKQGLTYLKYDTKFAFAEVNGDRITWLATKRGFGLPPEMTILSEKKNVVGKFISTKKLPLLPGGYVGRWRCREDITLEYKFEEGSEEERNAVERAVSYGTRPNTYRPDKKPDDVEIEIMLEEERPVGSDIEVKVAIDNKSSGSRTVAVSMIAYMSFYTGVLKGKIKNTKKELTVASGKSTHVLDVITVGQYAEFLVDLACMKFSVFGKVKETGQQVVSQDSVYLTTPDLKTEYKIVGYDVEVETEFVNPLPFELTRCTINYEGAKLVRSTTAFVNDVPAKGIFKHKMRFSPQEKGKKKLVIDFDSKQIGNITDIVEIEIP